MKAKMYGTVSCVWCTRVEKLLEEHGINVEKINVTDRKELITKWKSLSIQHAVENPTSVPQVFIDDKYIGGYTETERFLKRLDP